MFKGMACLADGIWEVLQRQGGFFLAFFIFNALTMCIHMVINDKTDVMLCYGAFMFLGDFLLILLLEGMPGSLRKWLKGLILFISFIPFAIEVVVLYNYEALIGVGVIASMLETNLKEAVEFASMYASIYELFSGLIALLLTSLVIFFKPWRKLTLPKKLRRSLASLMAIFVLVYAGRLIFEYGVVLTDPISPLERMVASSAKAVDNIRAYRELSAQLNNRVILTKNDSSIKNVVFILGESTNRNHMQLYGYYLPNTPYLTELAQKEELCVFRDVVSPHSTTIAVLSKLFTFCNNEASKPWYEYDNLIDIMKMAGYKTHWLSNQESSGIWGNVAQIYAAHSDVHKFTRIRDSREDYGLEDEALFPFIDEAIANRSGEKNFYVIHLMGGHGLYYNRFPYSFSKFNKDDITLNVNDDRRTVIAQYDNALYYNDYVVNTIIDKFRALNEDTVVVYLPDHGEAVYDEGGFVGHIEENANRHMIEVPLIMWGSPVFKSLHPGKWEAMRLSCQRPYMTDDMIHTMLDLTDISTAAYEEQRSIINKNFDNCRKRIFDNVDYDKEILTGIVKDKEEAAVVKEAAENSVAGK